ncbi:AI-2E family transporter [Salisaeta longa]|uniref:AI-2E family transporter n=1 Tax=Salisaeta longa TaxID=503170 RepID=UPI0003B39C9E|nr:AI-2E family transporter [Salisaeta longa]
MAAAPSNDTWNDALQLIMAVGGLALFLVLLYEMEVPPRDGSFLNPPLVALAGVILLWPLRKRPAVQALLVSGGTLLLLWILDTVSGILIPFVAVYLLAYLLNPVVTHLHERRGIPRWASSLTTTLLAVGALVLFFFVVAPNLVGQLDSLSQRLITAVEEVRAWLGTTNIIERVAEASGLSKQRLLDQGAALIEQQVEQLPSTIEDLMQSVGSVLGALTLVALVPVLLFYTLKDYPRIRDALIALSPTANGRRDYLLKAGGIVGRYLRGQLIISGIATLNVSVALYLFDVPFWLLIGLLTGVLNFIPNIGALINTGVGALLAFAFSGWVSAAVVVGVLLGQYTLEQSLLTPNVMQYQVGLHPVLVLFSLLVFGSFMGAFGLFVAVPTTAILVTGYRAYSEELTLDLHAYSNPPGA